MRTRAAALLFTFCTAAPAFAVVERAEDARVDLASEILLDNLAPTNRAFGDETFVASVVREKVRAARRNLFSLNLKPSLAESGSGDLVVRLPGTGRHLDTKRSVALHIPQNQSCGRGLGLAMALTLIDDFTIEHPPLELVFTKRPGTLERASGHFDQRLRSECVIDLEADLAPTIEQSTAGAYRLTTEGTLPVAKILSGWNHLSFKISAISKDPDATARTAAFAHRLLSGVFESEHSVRVIAAEIGAEDRRRGAPDDLKVVLAAADARTTASRVHRIFEEARNATVGADHADLIWLKQYARRRTLTRDASVRLVDLLYDLSSMASIAKNGTAPDLSADLDYFKLHGIGRVDLRYTVRSNDENESEAHVARVEEMLRGHLANRRKLTTTRALFYQTRWDASHLPIVRMAERAGVASIPAHLTEGSGLDRILMAHPKLPVVAVRTLEEGLEQLSADAMTRDAARVFAALRALLHETATCERSLLSPTVPPR